MSKLSFIKRLLKHLEKQTIIILSVCFCSTSHALIIPMNTGQMEALTIRSVNGVFNTITLENTYTTPVIVCTHNIASASNPPAVVRIRNAGATSFEIRLQRPRDSAVVIAADVYCLVAEEGANELADGRQFEARTVVSEDVAGSGIPGPDWNGRGEDVSMALTNTYTNPVVLGQVMTFNDSDFSIFWSYDCESNNNPPFNSGFADGICVGKHIGEDDADETRNDELLGYFVIEAGSGTTGTIQYQTALGPDTILGVSDSPPYPYTLNDTYNFGVATIEAMDGTNGGFANLFGTNPFESNQLDLVIDEDQLRDAERNRTTDQMGFWVFKESDYGDAPDSYSTLSASGGPEHLIQSGFSISSIDDIFIGSSSSSETDGNPTTDGNPATNDTDDGAITFPLAPDGFSAGDTYSITVPYTGNARLCGWIDFDYNGQTGDGTFETDERACINTSACSGGGISGTCVLTFTAPADFIHNNTAVTYARFRIGPNSIEVESPGGIAFGGEVEDYEIVANTLPVTLSHFSSKVSSGKIELDWGTSSELFNVGFQLWGLDGVDGGWKKLHNWLVKSGNGNAVEPQSYRKRVKVPNSIDQLISVGISSVDSDGSEHYYGPFELGQAYGDLDQMEPIAWDKVRSELDARMTAAGYVKDRVNGYRKVSNDTSAQALSASSLETVVEFSVSADGLYRITSAELAAADIDWSGALKRDIAVIDTAGEPVVRYVKSGRKFGTGGEIYVYGHSPDERAGLYTDQQVYRLVLDRNRALNAPKQGKSGVSSGFSPSYTETSMVEDDWQYIFHSAADDPWVSAVVMSEAGKPRLHGLSVPMEADADLSQSLVLHLGLGKSSDLPGVGDEHVVRGAVLSEGGLLYLGSQTSNDTGLWDVEIEIPGNTPLTLNDDGHPIVGGEYSPGSGYAFSQVHVDRIGLSYARPYVPKRGDHHLEFSAPDEGELGYEVVLPDDGYPWVFASDGDNLVRIVPESARRSTDGAGNRVRTVRFGSLLGSTGSDVGLQYWVGARQQALTVDGLGEREIATQASLLAQVQGSNYVMIAHPMFMGDALNRYADHKRGEGYRVSLINYLDVVDAYGGGQAGPVGLTAYLSALEAQGVGIEYVLMVGGSTYDHTGNGSSGAITFIPAHYGESDYSKFTVSDAPYVMDGDGHAFASIGRWPVRSVSDVETIVDKSIVWSSKDHSSGEALLIAEHTVDGEGIDFGLALDGVAASLPVSYNQTQVYVDRIMAENPQFTLTQALSRAKSQIIAGLNQGPDVVLYNGHASTRQLSNQNLLKSGDVSQVTSAGAEVWIPLSCYVTFFENTDVNSLSYQLMFSGNAVGITGAMLLSNQGENLQMGASILEGTMNNGMTLGDAVNNAKAALNNPNVNINWNYLGDPSVMMNAQ